MSTYFSSLRNCITQGNASRDTFDICKINTTPNHKICAMIALFSYSQNFIIKILICIQVNGSKFPVVLYVINDVM
jgi:hypothetical protein